jgi:hypothetical protein
LVESAASDWVAVASNINSKIAEYASNGEFKNIKYDAPLGKVFSDIQELSVEQEATAVEIVGNGLILGFEFNSAAKFTSTHVLHNKTRENERHGKGISFINGGRFVDSYKVTFEPMLEEQKIEVKKIFYKGTISNVLVNDLPCQISFEQPPVKLGFTNNAPKLVHQINENRAKVYNWCTANLNRVEDCTLFNHKGKNVIVIFSSSDRPYLTNSKKQYLQELAIAWKADLQIINDPLSVLTEEQVAEATAYESRRPNILNYVCKILVVYNALAVYDRVMWLDDTNVISPFAPNLFNVVPADALGALVIPRESGLNDAPHDYRYILKNRDTYIDDIYYNTGVMVIPKIYRNIFSFEAVSRDADLFQSPYPTQCWQNYLMKVHNCNVYDISCMYNMMPCCYHFDRTYNEVSDLRYLYSEFLKYHIVHFTGFHKHREMLHAQFLDHCERTFNQKITIVIMNFKRSDNIKNHILPYYDNIMAVGQIILVHCLESTVFEYDSPKVQHVYEWETDKEYGVFTRYIAAKKYTKNRCVLFTDDDVILPAKTLSMVYQKWKEDPRRVVGAEGRRIYKDLTTGEYQYKSVAYHGDVDFLLTSCCMASYENILAACKQEPIMGNYKNTTAIKWNGEDMFLCLTASVYHDIKCYSVDSPIMSLDEGNHTISRVSSHIEERCRFLNLFFSRYASVSTFKPIEIPVNVTTVKKSKEILSLGSMCWTKMMLKKYHEQESFPFDSIDSRTINNVQTVIKDLLENKLDYEKFVIFDQKNYNHYGLRFPHHNPPPENQKDSNLETFKRRLLRFKDVYLDTNITKLFIFFNRPHKKQSLAEYEEILKCLEDILSNSAGEDNQCLIINNIRKTAILNYRNKKITQIDLEFYSINRDENNVEAHLEHDSHFIPAYKKANIPEFLLNFLSS